MNSALSVLEKYRSTLKQIVERKLSKAKGRSTRQALKFGAESDFDFMIAATDIIDDTSSAIFHIQKYGLSGPTKYDDLGEMYLRLYGILSAVYIQGQSALALFRIFNVPHLKEMKKAFDELAIRQLRHKLAAHSIDYLDKLGAKNAYVPLRFDLADRSVTAVRHNQPMQHEKVELTAAIEEHLKLMVVTIDKIVEKAITMLFLPQSKDSDFFRGKLSDHRIEKDGGLVLGGDDKGPKIIITFVGPKKNHSRPKKRATAARSNSTKDRK